MRKELSSGNEDLPEVETQEMPSPEKLMAESIEVIEEEKEKQLIDFLTRFLTRITLKEFYETENDLNQLGSRPHSPDT